MSNSRFYVVSFLLLAISSFIIFSPSFGDGPIFDDNQFIFESKRLTGAPSALSFWNNKTIYYRSWPLSYSVLWTMHQFFIENYWAYKTLNILTHILNSFLLLLIVVPFLGRKVSLLVALGFALHPLQVETISWIFQIKTILATSLALACTLIFLKFYRRPSIYSALGTIYLFFFSLMAKPVAIMAPFLMAAMLLSRGLGKHLIILIPIFWIAFQSGSDTIKGVTYNSELEAFSQKNFAKGVQLDTTDLITLESYFQSGLQGQRLLVYKDDQKMPWYTPIFCTAFYITKFFLPFELSINYGKFTSAEMIYYCMGALLILVFFYLMRRRKFFVYNVALACYLLSVFPIIGLFYVPYVKYSLVADHWAYLAIAPLCVLLFYTLRKFTFACLLVLALWAAQSINYAMTFNNPVSRLYRVTTTAPTQFLTYIELANVFIGQQDFPKAKQILQKGLAQPSLEKNAFLLMQLAYVLRNLDSPIELKGALEKLVEVLTSEGQEKLAIPLIEELEEYEP